MSRTVPPNPDAAPFAFVDTFLSDLFAARHFVDGDELEMTGGKFELYSKLFRAEAAERRKK